MAKLFKTSIFLVLAGFVLVAEAGRRDDHKKSHSHDDDDDLSDSPVATVKGLIPIVKVGKGGNKQGKGDTGGDGCKCSDAKLKDFVKKFSAVYQAYASKELAPELKSMFGKMSDFTMDYLAKEKPGEVGKVHSFLKNSVQKTGSALGQA